MYIISTFIYYNVYEYTGLYIAQFLNLNSLSILSAIIFAIASDEVAPGEGAFLQCKTRLPIAPDPGWESNTKSSIKVPEKAKKKTS